MQHSLPRQSFQLSHVKTRPTKHRRLIYKTKRHWQLRNGSPVAPTDLVSRHLHLLAHNGLNLLALETYVYECEYDRVVTLFVSKADTTGYYDAADTHPLSICRVVTSLLADLLDHHVPRTTRAGLEYTTRICLFAKAEPQYLFPFSSHNPRKHVLSDGALVRWWIRALEPLKSRFAHVRKSRLQIPGADSQEISLYLPGPDASFPWQVGDIFGDNDQADPLALLCIPRFDDDPKVRFLDDLVLDGRITRMRRRQFWLELQARQEFRLGSVVGIVGIEGSLGQASSTPLPCKDIHAKRFEFLFEVLKSEGYQTRADAQTATDIIWSRMPEEAKFEVQGILEPGKAARPTGQAVNVLSSSMVRKKKRV